MTHEASKIADSQSIVGVSAVLHHGDLAPESRHDRVYLAISLPLCLYVTLGWSRISNSRR